MTVAAILLAAGQSRRMGRCKQLLPLGSSRVIDRCLDTLLTAGVEAIVVVVSNEGAEVAQAAVRPLVRVAVNPHNGGDMASSVRTGRDTLPASGSGVIVALCDYPLVLPTTVSQLIRTHAGNPGQIVIPCHRGQRGHPLLFPRSILAELAPGMILRDLVRSDPQRVLLTAVADPGILLDMDTPADYQRLSSMLPPA